MNTIEATLTAPHLLLRLSAELGVTPSLIVETIKESPELVKLISAYGRGETTYNNVLATLVNCF
jgi:hypothetical protein